MLKKYRITSIVIYMKIFRIISICVTVLSVLLICMISCSHTNSPVDSLEGTDEIETTDTTVPVATDTEPLYIDDPTCVDDPITTEYSLFRKSSTVIAELGEPIRSSDGQLLTFTGESESTERNFAIFPIKIHKKFEATAYSDESFFNTDVMLEKDEEHGIDRTQTYLNFVLDYPNKDEIISQYDDVILIESEYTADVIPGEKYFVVLSFGHVDYSHLLYGEHERKTAIGWMPVGNRITNKPDLIPVRDDKICLPDDYLDTDPTGEESFVRRLADMTWYANTMLTHFGLDDLHFRDGMTIDELERFFEYETDELLYGVFFRDIETQEP